MRIDMPDIPNEHFSAVTQYAIRVLSTISVPGVTLKIPASEIRVTQRGISNRITKGKCIWNRIQEIVDSGKYVSREVIANECQTTVSRVAEILKEKSDNPIAQKYRRMAAEEKMQRSLSKEIEKESRHVSLIEILNNEDYENYKKETESNYDVGANNA